MQRRIIRSYSVRKAKGKKEWKKVRKAKQLMRCHSIDRDLQDIIQWTLWESQKRDEKEREKQKA